MSGQPAKTHVDIEELVGELAEQYAERLRHGENPAVEDYIRQYPEAAEALRQILPALHVIGSAHHEETTLHTDAVERSLGDFRIVQEIGRGGMGVMFEAEQISIGRLVALKVLPFASMLDRQQLNRFKNEVRAAGTLDHPNIVAVHSVGTERGVHYYAMQLVVGQSLAEIIDRRRGDAGKALHQDADATIAHPSAVGIPHSTGDTRPVAALSTVPDTDTNAYYRTVARLGVQAAEALDHAHRNGIIHRDVKPGNLLVDTDGKLWVTDFGLARIEADVGMTMSGDLIGTLRYMSPEQALAKRVVIDHRTDIYSLGVTLYELFTLTPPYVGTDRQELLKQIAFDEPRKIRQINRRIPCDLETIIAKAMEKSPADRYDTAQELADDLKRFLDDEPIRASRPTIIIQRVAKWSRRHQPFVASAAGIMAVLLFGAILATALVWREKQRTQMALDDAESQRKYAEDQAVEATRAAAESEALVTFFVNDLMGSIDPSKALGNSITVAEVVADAERKLDMQFAEQPLLKAAIQAAIGRVHFSLGNDSLAEGHLRQALDVQQRLLGEAPATLRTMSSLSAVLGRQERWLESIELTRRTLEHKRRVFGPNHLETLREQDLLADCLRNLGEFDECRQLLEQTLESMRAALGPNHLDTLKVQWHLCVVLGVRDWKRVGQLADATLQALRDTVGADHPETLFVESQVAQRKNDESFKRFQEILTDFERIYGPVHPMTLYAHREVIERWVGAGDVEKALELNRALLESLQRELGKDSPRLFELTHQRIDLLEQNDAKAQSVALAESLLQTTQRVSGPQHPHTLMATEKLGDVLESNGEQERSIQVHQDAANLARQLYGPTSFEAGRLMLSVGYGHLQLNRYEEAEECYRQASSILRDAVGEKHWSTLNAQYHVAICLRKRGEFDAATTLLKQSLAIADREHGTDSHVSIQYARALANCFEDQDRGEEAGVWRQRTGEEFYRSEEWDGAAANLRRAARHHVEPTRKASALFWLSMAYWQSEQWQNARQAFDAARELTKTAPNNEELKKLQERADTLIGKTAAERRIARLSQEIEQKPGEFRLWRSRARLFAVEGRWNEAAADWAKWIELSEDKRSWSSPLKSACRELAGWPEIFVRLVDTLPDESTLWLASGQYHALRSQWAAAASDYARAFQSRPLNDRSICEYAGVLLLAGDTDGYQQICAQIVDRANAPRDVKTAYDMARTCAIGPADDIDPELMIDWANERLLKEPDKAYVQFVAALAQYRAGQFERAIETLKETPRDAPNDLWQAKKSFVIAMSHQRLGDEGAAQEALRRGQERVVDAGPKTSDQPANLAVPDWIELELLRREAVEVLGPDQAKDQDR